MSNVFIRYAIFVLHVTYFTSFKNVKYFFFFMEISSFLNTLNLFLCVLQFGFIRTEMHVKQIQLCEIGNK